MSVQSEWHARLDFLLVLVAVVVISLLVFRLIGPQIYAITANVIERIGAGFASLNSLLSGVTGGR